MPQQTHSPPHPPTHSLPIVTADWLTSNETRAVLSALKDAGFDARVVGGAVRNTLLNRPVLDIDIATTAQPEQTIEAAKSAGLHAIPTGLQHGTVTLASGAHMFEVTTLRRDVETDGRHAQVEFTDDWAADAHRRDFTINALYCDADGGVHDFVGGLADLDPPQIRFIGDARERIREDYLRILRFFRFSAAYTSGALDPIGLAACIAERSGLGRISAERIRSELLKLLVAQHAVPVLTVMAEHGLAAQCIGLPSGAAYDRNLLILARVVALEAALNRTPDPLLRLAALLAGHVVGDGDAVQTALHVATTLRLSNDERRQLVALRRRDLNEPLPTAQCARRALQAEGIDLFRARVVMQWAAHGAPIDAPEWRDLYVLPDRWTAPHFPLTGADLLTAGVTPGPTFGRLLHDIEAWWIAQDFIPDRNALLKELARRLASPNA
jgi:poly(A) polymerase